MARSRVFSRRRTRPRGGRRRTPFARRSSAKRRSPRRSHRSSKMSNRRILNITSRKKRDTMLNVTNITAATPVGNTSYAPNPAIFPGATPGGHLMVFAATARDATTTSTPGLDIGSVFDRSTRTATTCFMRGLSESIEIQVADGLPWQWRRICVTLKGTATLLPNTTSFSPYLETSSGYTRVLNQPSPATRTALQEVIFKGRRGDDWSNEITAQVDTTRVTVWYDRTKTIASGNDDGSIRKHKMWHSMNKNLVYSEDEIGGTQDEFQKYSTTAKPGMGDYLVLDYLFPRTGSLATNLLSFSVNSSLYWHER